MVAEKQSGRRRDAMVLLVGAGVLLAAASARAGEPAKSGRGPTYRRNRGHIVFSSKPFEPTSTEKEFKKQVSKARRTKSLAQNDRGNWPFHFYAFLRRPPKAGKVFLVFYKRTGHKWEQVDYVEFNVPPKGVTMQAKAELKAAQFKAGDTVEARITRLQGKREIRFAKARFKLR